VTQLKFNQAGKKFSARWIFRKVNETFRTGEMIAVTGPNGSGKSTLLMMAAGFISPDEGFVEWIDDNKKISIDDAYRILTFASPYSELMEEFSPDELLRFYQRFKPMNSGYSVKSALDYSGIGEYAFTKIKFLSSGMKQRLKLVLALLFESKIVLLDEPFSHIDKPGEEWVIEQMKSSSMNRIIFIASNQKERETFLCNRQLEIEKFPSGK